jgi:hypothetical protein
MSNVSTFFIVIIFNLLSIFFPIFLFQMLFPCPVWRDAKQAISALKITCPPDYRLYSVVGMKGRSVVICSWTVNYILQTEEKNWKFEEFVRDMERIQWENADTCSMEVLRISGQVICQHVFSLRCQKGEHCKRDGWSYMMQDYHPGLHEIDDVGVEMYWPNVVEVVNDDNNEDKGYHSLNEEESQKED